MEYIKKLQELGFKEKFVLDFLLGATSKRKLTLNERAYVVKYYRNLEKAASPLQNVRTIFKTEEECIDYFIKIIPFAILPTRPAKTKFIKVFTSHNAFLKVAEAIGKSFFNSRF